ncbi:MAG: Fur family transcriptional regulator [Thermoanaerobaculia bacterium]|nr:Fur family transcriptional regulator [Thermoanaerobaculia bacterium]
MPPEREQRAFVEFLRQRGMRVTAERLALLDEVFAQHGHLDAEQLFMRMQAHGHKISRATVYRNLDLLVECGLVRKYRLGHDRFLFEHVHPGQSHDHIACRECGSVVEFVSPAISALLEEILKAHGFVPEESALQVMGLCGICAASRPEEKAEVAAS